MLTSTMYAVLLEEGFDKVLIFVIGKFSYSKEKGHELYMTIT